MATADVTAEDAQKHPPTSQAGLKGWLRLSGKAGGSADPKPGPDVGDQLPAVAVPAPQAVQAGDGPEPGAQQAGKPSWMARISGAYSSAVRGSAKALHKLTTRERVVDFHDASEKVEKQAAEVEGPARTAAMQQWTAAIGESGHSCSLRSEPTPSQTPAPDSPCRDAEWQQLQMSPRQPGARGKEGSAAAAADAPFMYQDASTTEAPPMSFRHMFLRSNALERLAIGFGHKAAADGDEAALQDLLHACLGGDAELHGRLAALMIQASAAAQLCRTTGSPEASWQPICSILASVVTSLKQQAAAELLDMRIASLQAQVAASESSQQAPSADKAAAQPDSSPSSLTAGVTSTAATMDLAKQLGTVCQERLQLSQQARDPEPAIAVSLEAASKRKLHLEQELEGAAQRTSATQAEKEAGEAFRVTKLEELSTALEQAQGEVADLGAQKAALLAQLAQVESRLAQAHARKADLQEGRSVFEEGNAFTLEALQHKLDELAAQQRQDGAEVQALATGCATLALTRDAAAAHLADQRSLAADVAGHAVNQYTQAVGRHLGVQQARLQLLLRQLTFCSSELCSLTEKRQHVLQMGMTGLLADVHTQQQRLQQQYLDAQAASQTLLQTVDGIHSQVGGMLQHKPEEAELKLPEELQDLFHSIEGLRRDCEAVPRPPELPDLSDSIENVQVGGASSAALSRVQSSDEPAEQDSAADPPDAASQASIDSSAAVPSSEAAG